MKQFIKFVAPLILFALAGTASAQQICRAFAEGAKPGRDKPVATIAQSRLAPGETCDSWRSKLPQGGEVCVLYANGENTYEGHGNTPPARGKELVRGKAPDCDKFREERHAQLVTG